MPRIAIAGFAHETNTFSPTPTDFADFLLSTTTRSGLRGAEILENPDFAMPIGGFAAAAREAGDELVPICWYAAEPAGIVTANAFERIVSEIVHGVATAGRLDGVYLDLHGAMVAAGHEMMRAAARLADEARELEKGADSVLRTPHAASGEARRKTRLSEKPE